MLYTLPPLSRPRTALMTTLVLLCSVNFSFAKDSHDTHTANTVVKHTLEHAGDALETVTECVADSNHCDRALVKTTAKITTERTVSSAIKTSAPVSSITKRVLKTGSGEMVAGALDCASDSENCGRALKKATVLTVANALSIPTAVTIASAIGTTASTGTSVAVLSGAAATSATTAAFGSTLISATGGALGTVAAPAVIGAAAIGMIGVGVGYLILAIFD